MRRLKKLMQRYKHMRASPHRDIDCLFIEILIMFMHLHYWMRKEKDEMFGLRIWWLVFPRPPDYSGKCLSNKTSGGEIEALLFRMVQYVEGFHTVKHGDICWPNHWYHISEEEINLRHGIWNSYSLCCWGTGTKSLASYVVKVQECDGNIYFTVKYCRSM